MNHPPNQGIIGQPPPGPCMGPYLSSGAQENRDMTDDNIVPIKKAFIGASSIVRVVSVVSSYVYKNEVLGRDVI